MRRGYRPARGSLTRINGTSSRPATMPKASPTAVARANSRTTIRNEPWLELANWIIASINAIPTGSLAPDSPSRMVSVRPPTSRRPSTENITAGSVGASAAPIRPEVVQPRPSSRWQPAATTAAVPKVPSRPSEEMGTSEERKRRQPMCMPPSNRITTTAPTTNSPMKMPSM